MAIGVDLSGVGKGHEGGVRPDADSSAPNTPYRLDLRSWKALQASIHHSIDQGMQTAMRFATTYGLITVSAVSTAVAASMMVAGLASGLGMLGGMAANALVCGFASTFGGEGGKFLSGHLFNTGVRAEFEGVCKEGSLLGSYVKSSWQSAQSSFALMAVGGIILGPSLVFLEKSSNGMVSAAAKALQRFIASVCELPKEWMAGKGIFRQFFKRDTTELCDEAREGLAGCMDPNLGTAMGVLHSTPGGDVNIPWMGDDMAVVSPWKLGRGAQSCEMRVPAALLQGERPRPAIGTNGGMSTEGLEYSYDNDPGRVTDSISRSVRTTTRPRALPERLARIVSDPYLSQADKMRAIVAEVKRQPLTPDEMALAADRIRYFNSTAGDSCEPIDGNLFGFRIIPKMWSFKGGMQALSSNDIWHGGFRLSAALAIKGSYAPYPFIPGGTQLSWSHMRAKLGTGLTAVDTTAVVTIVQRDLHIDITQDGLTGPPSLAAVFYHELPHLLRDALPCTHPGEFRKDFILAAIAGEGVSGVGDESMGVTFASFVPDYEGEVGDECYWDNVRAGQWELWTRLDPIPGHPLDSETLLEACTAVADGGAALYLLGSENMGWTQAVEGYQYQAIDPTGPVYVSIRQRARPDRDHVLLAARILSPQGERYADYNITCRLLDYSMAGRRLLQNFYDALGTGELTLTDINGLMYRLNVQNDMEQKIEAFLATRPSPLLTIEQMLAYNRAVGVPNQPYISAGHLFVAAWETTIRPAIETAFPAGSDVAIVHVSQTTQFVRPVVLTEFTDGASELRLETSPPTRLFDGAQLFTGTVRLVHRKTGELLATTSSQILVQPTIESTVTEPGPRTFSGEPIKKVTITREAIARYAEVAMDPQPIHLDPAVARRAGFRDVIAHGMWLAQYAEQALHTEHPDRPSTHRRTVKFLKAVHPGDEIRFYSELFTTRLGSGIRVHGVQKRYFVFDGVKMELNQDEIVITLEDLDS